MHVGVDVRNLTAGSITGISRVLIETAKELSRKGVRFTFYWPGNRHASPLDDIADAHHVTGSFAGAVGRLVWSASELPWAVRRAPPDVFWGPAHRLPFFMPSHVPMLVTIHDLVWYRYPRTMAPGRHLTDRMLMQAAIRRANRIVAVSKATAKDVTSVFGVSQIDVVYPGVTQTHVRSNEPLLPPAYLMDKPYALFVGTLEPRKNLERLLRAFVLARRGGSKNWHLVVAGGKGWKDHQVRQTLEPLVASGYVHVTGYISEAELSALYAGARFLALPSLYEGFGLPIIEAQQYGVPVLASHCGSLPEVTGSGGLLVDPRNEREIASAVERLFASDDLHASLAFAARENVRRFTWDKCADGMIAAFEAARSHSVLRATSRP